MQLIGDFLPDLEVASKGLRDVEMNCTVETFVTAVKGMNKVRNPKVTQIEKELEGMGNSTEPQKLVAAAGKIFLEIIKGAEGHQKGWLLALMKADNGVDPSKVSSSVRAIVEYEADKFLRAIGAVQDFPSILEKLQSAAKIDGVKVNEILVSYISLATVTEQEWKDMGRNSGIDVIKTGVESINGIFVKCKEAIQNIKKEIVGNGIYQRQLQIVGLLDNFDSDKLLKLLSTEETIEKDETLMKELSACFLERSMI